MTSRYQEVALARPPDCSCYWVRKALAELQPDERAEVEQDRSVSLLPTATVMVRLSSTARCPVHDPLPPLPLSVCHRCQVEIVTAVDRTMNPIEVDAEPSPDGTLELVWNDARTQVLARVVRTARQRFGRHLHHKHRDTCTNTIVTRGR